MFPSSWFSGVTPLDVWAAVLALLLTGSVVFAVVKVVHPVAQKITRVVDAFLGRPASQGLPAIPGVIERLNAQDAELADQGQKLKEQGEALALQGKAILEQGLVLEHVKDQVTPNHGSTFKLSEEVQALQHSVEALLARVDIPRP